ncbi:hypothetical protein KC723_03200 [Candidatus Kaiserbacteria bacterium]|nr:hypothetical protein [Candidatus Kaiserbacteria bacterium]
MFLKKTCVTLVALTMFLLLLSAQASFASGDKNSKIDDQYPVDVSDPWAQDEYLRKVIAEVFADEGKDAVWMAQRVAACESSGNPRGPIIHWELDGSGLLLNKPVDPNDKPSSAAGNFQILLNLHAKWLKNNGFVDVTNDEYQYTEAAKALFVGNGRDWDDWNQSKNCWETKSASN